MSNALQTLIEAQITKFGKIIEGVILNFMKSGFNKDNFDTSTRPQDDFFQFATGNWIKNNPIPSTETRWNTFAILREKSLDALHNILDKLSNSSIPLEGEEKKLKDFYQTAMDADMLNQKGAHPLQNELNKIKNAKNTNDIVKIFGHLGLLCLNGAISLSIELDEKDSSRYMIHIWQDGLGLPDREYYLRQDHASVEIRSKYIRHITQMFELVGYTSDDSSKSANVIMDMEIAMAKASTSQEELRQVEKQYHKMTFAELVRLAPQINWKLLFEATGIEHVEEVIVGQPEFLQTINQMISERPLENWKIYLTWKLVRGTARFLSDEIVQKDFEFYGTTLTGTKEIKPRWKRAVILLDWLMWEALGKLYVQKYFGQEANKKINELVDHIIHAYEKRIKNLDWMSIETKKKAIEKLHRIHRKLAYPDKWHNYDSLEIQSDSFLQNYFRAAEFESRRCIAKLNKPVDRQEWFMSPPTVNAYYSYGMNDINFPAGILQSPFFDPEACDAINYGAIGSVIGHELTHGFDDQGGKFDANGNMNEWWTAKDREQFNSKAQILVKQYSEYIAVDDLHLNGKLTLGENIADLGGLCIALEAFQMLMKEKTMPKQMDGFTQEQLFFLGFVQVEQGHHRPEEQRRLATIDPHSPPRYRVNGVVTNMEAFYRAFDVKHGDAMYRSPEERANIW